MDASVEQLKRRRRRVYGDEESVECVYERGRGEEGGECECVFVCVCAWKKEAEPVNGELAGFLPLETSGRVTFHVDWITDGSSSAGPKKGALFRGGEERLG